MTKDNQGIWSVTVGPLGAQLWWYVFRAYSAPGLFLSVEGLKELEACFAWQRAGGADKK